MSVNRAASGLGYDNCRPMLLCLPIWLFAYMALPTYSFDSKGSEVDRMNNHLVQKVFRFLRSEDGPTSVEYALMLALIVLAAMAGIVAVGQSTSVSLEKSGNKIPAK